MPGIGHNRTIREPSGMRRDAPCRYPPFRTSNLNQPLSRSFSTIRRTLDPDLIPLAVQFSPSRRFACASRQSPTGKTAFKLKGAGNHPSAASERFAVAIRNEIPEVDEAIRDTVLPSRPRAAVVAQCALTLLVRHRPTGIPVTHPNTSSSRKYLRRLRYLGDLDHQMDHGKP